MCMQETDYVYYRHKKYSLIDVEEGKQMIDTAKFIMPPHIGGYESTSCYRGYIAKYRIIKNKLYGIRYEDVGGSYDFYVRSAMKRMHYTGSCVVAANYRSRFLENTDFLECYLDYQEAIEMHFTDGILDGIWNLKDAIQEAIKIERLEDDKGAPKITPYEIQKMKKRLAYDRLHFQYDKNRSYKWRDEY